MWRQDVWRVGEEEQTDLWVDALRDERVVKKRDGKRGKKEQTWLNGR